MASQVWQHYVDSVMYEGQCADYALVNTRTRRVLAASAGGALEHVSRREVRALMGVQRERLQTRGLRLGGLRCVVLRDNLATPDERSMDLRTKQRPSRGVAVCCTRSVLVVFMGHPGTRNEVLNDRAQRLAACLRNAGS